jgi:hypothetical protein
MKRFFQIQNILFLGFITILINSCQKQGPAGPEGPKGTDGQNGSNHVSSKTFTMTSWSFTAPYYYRNLGIPELTSNNIDSALVMVYFATIGSNWLALPYTQYNSPYDYFMGFVSYNGNVQVTWFYDSSLSSGSDPNAYYGTTIRCKVVVVPPAMKKKYGYVNMKNYDQVKQTFNLID